MPTVIDSLLVRIGIDGKGVKTGGKVVSNTVKGLEKELNGLKSTAKSVAIAFGGPMLAKSIFDIGKNIINTTADVGRMSHNLMISANDLKKWQNAVKQVGGEGEEATQSLLNLQTAFTQLKFGEVTPQTSWLSSIFGNKNIKTKDDMMEALHEYFTKVSPDVGVNMAGRVGISGSMYNLLVSGDYKKILEDAADSSKNTESSVEKAMKLQKEMVDIEQQVFDTLLDLTVKVTDLITEYFPKAIKITEDIGSIIEPGPALTNKTPLTGNQNPFGLKYAGQKFAQPGEGGFAKFSSLEDAIAAEYRQLQLDRQGFDNKGKRPIVDTIEGLINKYTPTSDNKDTPGYIKGVAKALGKKPNEKLDISNLSEVASWMRAITAREGSGAKLTDDMIREGIKRSGAKPEGGQIVHIEHLEVTSNDPKDMFDKIIGYAGEGAKSYLHKKAHEQRLNNVTQSSGGGQ